MSKIEDLEYRKKIKEEELAALEKELREARLSDLKSRFNLVEDQYYRIDDNDGCGRTYFYYTPNNAYVKNNQLVILESIHEFIAKAYTEIGFRGVSYYDLAPQPTVAINEKPSANSICEPLIAELFSKKLYGESSLKIEAVDFEEICRLKSEITQRVNQF